jgi:flagellar hook-basal body complex protein FliE
MRIEDLTRYGMQPLAPRTEPSADTGKDFGQLLMDALREVNKAQLEAGELREAFVKGEAVELHDVLIALEKSGVALQLAIEVRNKLLEAYQEISRIPA